MTDRPVTTPEPWPDWLADLDPEDRVRKVVRAVAACYGGDSHDQPATQHCSIGVAEMLLSRLLDEARQQAHYLSTSCFHGEHLYCQSGTGAAEGGETWVKVPASCKFCKAPCRCGCHSGEAAAAAGPVSFAAAMELRAQIAEALDGFLGTEQATIAADSVMVVVVPLLRSAAEPAGEPQDGNPAAEVPSEPVMELLESAWKLICDITSSAVTVPDGWIERAGTWHGRYWDLVREYAAAMIATALYGSEPEHRGGFCSLCGNTNAGDLGAAIGICLDGKACRWRQSALMRNARERDIARADAAEQRQRIASAVTLIGEMNAHGVAAGITGELAAVLTGRGRRS